MAKGKAHIIYRHEKKRVPGATTVLGLREKPQLIYAANKLGLAGYDSAVVWGEMADIGTLSHQMIVDHFAKKETDVSDYTPNQVKSAENSLLSFYEWEKGKVIDPIWVEYPLTCPLYGGTIDLYCVLDGVKSLIDFKTGKGIYEPEMPAQLAAYKKLLVSYGQIVEQCIVLNIPRTEDEKYEARIYKDLDLYYDWFTHLLNLYYAEKKIKKGVEDG